MARGGGVGVRYRDEEPPLIADYIQAVRVRIEGRGRPPAGCRRVSGW